MRASLVRMPWNTKLRRVIRSSSYNQKELGERLGVGEAAVSKWVRGKSPPNAVQIIEICRLTNVSAEYLLNDKLPEIPIVWRDGEPPKPVEYLPIAIRTQHDLEAQSDAQAKRENKRAKRKGGEPGASGGGAPIPGSGGAPHDRHGDGTAVAPSKEN
jgi:transcriptional regulator with XRE-family HTH domain